MGRSISAALLIALFALASSRASAAVSFLMPPSISVNGWVSPAHLSKTTAEPVTLNLGAKISRQEDSSLSTLKTLSFRFDRSGAIFTKGLPVCHITHNPDVNSLARPCLVGRGEVEFEIEPPEQSVFSVKAPLEIFNSVLPGGRRALIYQVHAEVPALTTFYSVGAVERTRGRFGTKVTIPIPMIVAGLGRVSSFHARIGRSWTYKGRRVSLLRARCPTGSLMGEAEMQFASGFVARSKVVKSCG